MADTNIDYVSKREFRVVSLILVPLIILGIWALLPLLRSLLAPGVTSKSTPIVVRGGSMTAYTERQSAPGGWLPKPVPPNYSGPYCVNIRAPGTSYYVELLDNDDNSTVLSSWQNPTMTYPMIVDIYGHDPLDPTLSIPSKTNGLEFTLQPKDCDGNDGKMSVKISTNGGGFYKWRLPGRKHHLDNLRFQVPSSANCADQDSCERMAAVVVTINGVQQNPNPGLCLDGDCTVVIGTE
jgi:hypothetical protein